LRLSAVIGIIDVIRRQEILGRVMSNGVNRNEREMWKRIDSAPMDRAILVYALGCHIAHFNTQAGRWIGYGRRSADTLILNSTVPPTHWMPLPDAPA
jgi:hypothetical protein